MTLILGMSKPEGIYMSSDYRVTEYPSGRLVDDESSKFLTVQYPPDNGGPKALLAYSGLAELPDKTPMGRWLRETLRGRTEVIDQSMAHLQARLDRDVAGVGVPTIVNVLVLEPKRRLRGRFSNIFVDPKTKRPRIHDSFGYVMQEVGTALAFANGSGAAEALAQGHMDRIRSQLAIRPRKVMDHMNLLATVNRRVAAKADTVSPYCHVSYVNADDRTSSASHVFLEPGEHVPFETPTLLFGIDLNVMAPRIHEHALAFFRGEKEAGDLNIDPNEINEEMKRRP